MLTTVGLVLLIMCVAAWLWFVPDTDERLKKLLFAVCIVCFVLWVLSIVLPYLR